MAPIARWKGYRLCPASGWTARGVAGEGPPVRPPGTILYLRFHARARPGTEPRPGTIGELRHHQWGVGRGPSASAIRKAGAVCVP